jgi:hypothetical protein
LRVAVEADQSLRGRALAYFGLTKKHHHVDHYRRHRHHDYHQRYRHLHSLKRLMMPSPTLLLLPPPPLSPRLVEVVAAVAVAGKQRRRSIRLPSEPVVVVYGDNGSKITLTTN